MFDVTTTYPPTVTETPSIPPPGETALTGADLNEAGLGLGLAIIGAALIFLIRKKTKE